MACTSRVVTIGALILTLQAPLAYAQPENGVTVDRGSPAGKEYALPVDQARRDAVDGGGGGDATAPPPAFGAGVHPDSASGRTGGFSGHRGARAGVARTNGPATPSDSIPVTTSAQRARERDGIDRALVTASAGGAGASEGSLAFLLGGVVVMVFGAAAGVLLRRRKA